MSGTSQQVFLEKNELWAEALYDFFNKRLRIDDYRGNVRKLVDVSLQIALEHNFEKIIVKTRQEHILTLLECGFVHEGVIRNYFSGSDSHFLCHYFNVARRTSKDWCYEDEILRSIQVKGRSNYAASIPYGYQIRKAEERDAEQLARLYGTVFSVYPTPLQKADYVKHVMNNGTVFYVAEREKKIVSAASAEVNETYHNAELTDCATLREHRKHGLMKHLLLRLETELRQRKIFCAYSLARAKSPGMNAVLYHLGYIYGGRLANNCYISESLEDMNIWMKDLSRSS